MFALHVTGAQKPQKETNANITANVSFSLAPMEEHVTMKSQCYIHVHVHQHMEELIAQNVCDNNCVQPCHIQTFIEDTICLCAPDAKVIYNDYTNMCIFMQFVLIQISTLIAISGHLAFIG